MDPTVWSFLLVVIAVCLVLWAVVKVLAKVVADRNTRRIITEGMSSEAPNAVTKGPNRTSSGDHEQSHRE